MKPRLPPMALPKDTERPLAAAVRRYYGIDVKCLVRMKSVWGLVTEDGRRFVWKQAGPYDDPRRLADLAGLLAAAAACGITAAGPLPSRCGTWLVRVEGLGPGYLQPWLDGRSLDVRSEAERHAALVALARLHRATSAAAAAGVTWRVHRFHERLRMKLAVLRQLWPMARFRFPELRGMERAVLANAQAAVAVYTAWCREPQGGGHRWREGLCHGDVAPHNLLWAEDGRISFIDFDQAGIDDPLADVFQFCNHVALLDPLGPGQMRAMVRTYAAAAGLSEPMERVLWHLLRFPDALIRALAQWARPGSPAGADVRVRCAVRAEQARFATWAEDGPWAEHGAWVEDGSWAEDGSGTAGMLPVRTGWLSPAGPVY